MSGRILTASRQAAPENSPEDDVISDDSAPAEGFERNSSSMICFRTADLTMFALPDPAPMAAWCERPGRRPDLAFRGHPGSGAGEVGNEQGLDSGEKLGGCLRILLRESRRVAPAVTGLLLAVTGNGWNIALWASALIYAARAVCWLFIDPVTPLE
jgi:hypothetical protein